MDRLEQQNLPELEAQTSDELNVEELEAVSGGARILPLVPDILGIVGSLFGGSGGASNKSSSRSRSSSSVEHSGNSHVTVHCGD